MNYSEYLPIFIFIVVAGRQTLVTSRANFVIEMDVAATGKFQKRQT